MSYFACSQRYDASKVCGLQETTSGGLREAYGHQCIPQIINSLRTSQNISVEGIHALASLLSTQELKAEAIQFGAPALLVQCLNTESTPLTKSACRCLTQLTRLMKGCQAVVEHGGIEALVAVLMDARTEASQCVLEISRTLEGSRAILTRSRDVVVQLAKACQVGAQALPTLVCHCCAQPDKCISHQSHSEATSNKIPCPATLTAFVHAHKQSMRNEHKWIMQELDDDDWQAKRNIVQTWALLSRCRSGVSAALEAGFTSVVIELGKEALKNLESGSSHQEMCRICVEFLVQMSHDEEGKAAILEANGIPVLDSLLKVKDEKTVMNAVNALMGITVDPAGKVPTIQVR